MLTRSLFARLEAKPGKEDEVAAFLMQGLQLAGQETTTPVWFALRLGPTTFGVFDAFNDETALQRHLDGPIAQALMQNAPALLASPPAIERIEVLGAKVAKSLEGPESLQSSQVSRLALQDSRPPEAGKPILPLARRSRPGLAQGSKAEPR